MKMSEEEDDEEDEEEDFYQNIVNAQDQLESILIKADIEGGNAQRFHDCLAQHTQLRELDLEMINEWDDSELPPENWRLVGKGISLLKHLHHLKLTFDYMNDEGMVAFADSLQLKDLTTLTFYSN